MADPTTGAIPDDWTLTTLGEICKADGGVIQTGPFDSQLHTSDYVSVGITSIMPVNIGDNRLIEEGIAHVLGTLDDKIELNRRMNETLEEMVQAIFKSWFVDFDPVRAKVDRRQPVGMDAETATLFPDGFEESEMGPIPKRWKVGPVETLAELKTDSVNPSLAASKLWEHYSIPAFDERKRPAIQLGSDIKSNKYVVPGESVLISKLNPQFPRVWLPDIQDEQAAVCSTEFMPFIPRLSYARSFLFELLSSRPFQTEILMRVTDSTGSRQRVKPTEVASIPVVKPPRKLVHLFSRCVSELHKQQFVNIHQMVQCAAIRDTLLPKLLSGQIRVPEAEKEIDEVL